MNADRYLGTEPAVRALAYQLYETVANLPLICPHGHVDPRLFAQADMQFGSPTELLLIPDHYIFRMLYSQGIPLEKLGIPTQDGTPVEQDHRAIWQTFAEHAHLFRGTPTGIWLRDELANEFGITAKLTGNNAQALYDIIAEQLQTPQFRPRALYERFNVEVLATTDAATDTLEHHQAIRDSDWQGHIIPTFRPDSVVNMDAAGWRDSIDKLSSVSGIDITDYKSYIRALEQRRAFFKQMGARATDHAALTPYTARLTDGDAEMIFSRALQQQATQDDAHRFTGHMLIEMARMSAEDGLVMQLHVGSLRNHNPAVYTRFGLDKGADIPVQTEYTRNLKPLLDAYGNAPGLTLILFTLDETTYGRELAPLAGHYPAVKIGPPWWFFDSLNGMRRFFDEVMETAGLYNTAGFNDDTRAFLSIPTRHDVWRRAACSWLAGLVINGIIDEEDATEMAHDAAYGLAKHAYFGG
ncbi:MAG: glucuronate isomerase [Anaerolineae bacterium]